MSQEAVYWPAEAKGLHRRATLSKLISKVHPNTDPHAVARGKIVKMAVWGCGAKVQPKIHYEEIRPIPAVHPDALPKTPFTTDCSGFTTMCYQYANAPDPNGLHYNGQGYTGTIMRRCKKIPLAQCKVGDLVVWGAFPGHHVAIIVLTDPHNPLLVSHGAENDPVEILFAVESQFQPAEVGFYTIFS